MSEVLDKGACPELGYTMVNPKWLSCWVNNGTPLGLGTQLLDKPTQRLPYKVQLNFESSQGSAEINSSVY
jgi:hypothetical protein